ncbi:hypothetical protein SLS59_001749 [Nothophoma quercina]|uniref:Uncharacterized protein n=1 Tax=Nothophoma quercina TaxID=749835 RepID=A0ABR3RY85_9PLEO
MSESNNASVSYNMSGPCRNNPKKVTNDALAPTLTALNKQIGDRHRERKAAQTDEEARADAAKHTGYHQRIVKPVKYFKTEAKNEGMKEEVECKDEGIPGRNQASVQGG